MRSYIDSVLPSGAMLKDIDCSNSFPEIKKKCKKSVEISNSCTVKNSSRMSDLIQKTKMTIPLIEDLIRAHHNCINKIAQEPGALAGRAYSPAAQKKINETCDRIGAAIEIKKNEIPWIRGEDFKKITVKKNALTRNGNFNTDYELSDTRIAKGITAQLNHNREALAYQYKENNKVFKCLNSREVRDCDFTKIRTHLMRLPDLRTESSRSADNTIDKEANSHFKADKCLLDVGEERHQMESVTSGAAEGIALTALTFGVGEVIAGIRTLNTTSNLAKVKQGLTFGMIASVNSIPLKHAYVSCSDEQKSTIELSQSLDAVQDNVCPATGGKLSQAKDKESNCLVSALLTAPAVLPFVSALPKIVLFMNLKISKDYKVISETKILRSEILSVATRYKNFDSYPVLSNKIDIANQTIRKKEFGKKVYKLDSVDWNKYSGTYLEQKSILGLNEKLAGMDPEIKRAIRGVLNKMNDRESFINYMEKLSSDVVAEIKKKGIPKELAALQNGEINQNATLRVLVKRAQERNRANLSAIVASTQGKTTRSRKQARNNDSFREAIAQGPFFDKLFKWGNHGMSTHFLQEDYVSDVIIKATNGNPQKFWDYLGSKRGVNFWVPLFDSAYEKSLSRPEITNELVELYLPFM